MAIGDQISMIRLEDDCFNPEHNPDVAEDRLQSVHVHAFTNSGHMTATSFPLIGNEGYKVLSGSEAIWAMQSNVYKVTVFATSLLECVFAYAVCSSFGLTCTLALILFDLRRCASGLRRVLVRLSGGTPHSWKRV